MWGKMRYAAVLMRRHQLVLWGATGFTGRLVAEYLLGRPAAAEGEPLRWALGGRNRSKLERLQGELGQRWPRAADLPLVVGDSRDRAAMNELASATDVVCTTVGPYMQYGAELVAACAESGTHYCDLTGEVPFIRETIDANDAVARESGARIVPCCGFDSIPSDLGCLLLQEEGKRRHGRPFTKVDMYVDSMRGGFSGGTAASLLGVVERARTDRAMRQLLLDPYALNPEGERHGSDGPDAFGIGRAGERWTAPFLMAPINTRVVRRSNAIMGYPYGREFRYREVTRFGRGAKGRLLASSFAAGLAAFVAASALPPSRWLLERFALPKPGEGPSREERESGGFGIDMVGQGPDQPLTLRITGSSDPGYGQTSKMLGEAALQLAAGQHLGAPGVTTPASCFGAGFAERLRASGMTFDFV